jgi:outer membrane lipopolysaccharide assembly protein LptE/RlpB
MEVKRKQLSREEKREKAVVDLINQMFIIAGHNVTYQDVVGVDNWFKDYTMTVEQGDELKKWGKKYLMKNLNMYAKQAEKEMLWFNLQWGLTYSNWEEYNKLKHDE